MNDKDYDCPYCGETIFTWIDPTVPGQDYIEDCEVCCNPIRIQYQIQGMDLTEFSATSIEQ